MFKWHTVRTIKRDPNFEIELVRVRHGSRFQTAIRNGSPSEIVLEFKTEDPNSLHMLMLAGGQIFIHDEEVESTRAQ